MTVLRSFGAGDAEVEELLAYNESKFVVGEVERVLPLPSEGHVEFWRRWAEEGAGGNVFTALQNHLPQLHFPIREGISKTEDFRAATLSGTSPVGMAEATGLSLEHPESLRLVLHETAAGAVPVLLPLGRADFETLVRALGSRCEPVPLLASMGACTVKGFNDWERIRAHQKAWLANGGNMYEWDAEFARLRENRDNYQDRFLILSDGWYSDMSPQSLGVDADTWHAQSVDIRMRHECTHYVTLRLFGSTRNNALDELICDFVGFSSTLGRFRADWFLRGMGLEDFPAFREGGRLRHYCPGLSEGAFKVLCALVNAAAPNLERFDERRPRSGDEMLDDLAAITALCGLTVEDMAAAGADERMLDGCLRARESLRRAG